MSARVDDGWLLTIPVQGSGLDAAGIVANLELAGPLRDLLRRFISEIAS
jgi:hypothetical protein